MSSISPFLSFHLRHISSYISDRTVTTLSSSYRVGSREDIYPNVRYVRAGKRTIKERKEEMALSRE